MADVRATDIEKNSYILEMQNKTNFYLSQRFLSSACKAYIAELKCAEEYKKLKKVAIIIIMMQKFPGIKEIEKYHTIWNFREEIYTNKILTEDIEIHVIEIPKYLKQKENGGVIEPWLEFIVNPKGEEVQKAMKKYKTIQEAVDELNRLNANKEVRELADLQLFAELDRKSELAEAREQGIEQGIQQGIEQGTEKGIELEKINIAKKMLELNIDIKIIMNTTGLSKKRIEKLKIEE